ncbi:MAG: hypothetical protein ABI867_44395 [Kofleriaceae bacterium]
MSGEAMLAYLAGIDLALIALELGDHARAAERARELLAGAEAHAATWYYGNAIHYANIALGHVALAANALESAKLHLAAAGATCGSPQLDSFGPDFELAQAILATGEHDAVVAYLEACKRFWRLDHGKLAQWSAAVSRGELPRMGRRSAQ